jgi:hypothetical protein
VRKPFQCRDCGSVEGYRSHPRNFIEKYILPVLGLPDGALRGLLPAVLPALSCERAGALRS